MLQQRGKNKSGGEKRAERERIPQAGALPRILSGCSAFSAGYAHKGSDEGEKGGEKHTGEQGVRA